MPDVQGTAGAALTSEKSADAHDPAPTTQKRPSAQLIALLVGVAVVGYGLDQATKAWASNSLDPAQPKQLVGSVLQLRLTHNPGAAFSIATNATWVLTIVAAVVIVVTIFIARRLRSRPWACALGLLIGGALGNLTDRFVRAPGGGKGHVVDFLELPHWPIFNVADCCVVTAACLIALLAFLGIGIDGRRASTDQAKGDETDE
ncbi:MAG TPA: signal peptidase II [Flexivirga sp.]|uniref:signal peptidase II n=1 Tax=Flexivirga sp. TaxID=1962927 RepID=UPI002B90F656|nr:signal peptidase II [Flexivirga sp.]HWC20906.1 signal peptidase II [Flexivirga sp.]